jgi:hypothetical protein
VSLAALSPARRQAGVDLRHFDGGRRNGGLLCVSMKMSASQRGESKTSNSRFDGMWGSHLPRTEPRHPTLAHGGSRACCPGFNPRGRLLISSRSLSMTCGEDI